MPCPQMDDVNLPLPFADGKAPPRLFDVAYSWFNILDALENTMSVRAMPAFVRGTHNIYRFMVYHMMWYILRAR